MEAEGYLAAVQTVQGLLEKAVAGMQACVDYEKEIGHPDAGKHEQKMEELRRKLG